MTQKSETRCVTPRCVDTIAKYGERYHMVYPGREPGIAARCEYCGGKQTDAGVWVHKCKSCGTNVAPGLLTGLFVPHSCASCMEKVRVKQRAEGRVCRACNQVFADCCC